MVPGTEKPTQNAANTFEISISSESIVENDADDLAGDESIRIENRLPKEAPSVYTSDDILCANVKSSAKRLLFWVVTSIQNKNLWALADTGSCRNLINEKFWKNLPIPLKMSPPGSTVVVAGDGKVLDLLGWVILNFSIAGQTVYHEVGIGKDLPVEFLIGGELMKPHGCTLQYSTAGRNVFHLGNNVCETCFEN